MFCWPNAHDTESKIVEQFKFLRDHLTAESTAEFCENSPGRGFLMELYHANHLDYESAFQSYLICLRTLLPLVSRSVFLRMFQKSCPGCATMQFLCIVYLHPILENEVNYLFRELLCDPRGDILHRNDIRQLAMMIRKVYTRQEDHFPYMACCRDFKRKNKWYNKVQAIAKLFSSEQFCQLMKRNSIVGAQIAHEMLKNYQENNEISFNLYTLLSNHQEFISQNKLDT